MKKLTILVAILIAGFAVASAQPRAIGGRIAYGIGASYQHSFGEKNMLQADLDFSGFYGVDFTATYNWIFPIKSWSHPGSWNWYAGVGGNLGVSFDGAVWFGVAGMIGVEYNFDKIPLILSVDWRPSFGPVFGGYSGTDFYYEGMYAGAVGIGAKYRF